MILMLSLAACAAPEANVECWDGTKAESADLCPEKPAPPVEVKEEVVDEGLSEQGEYAQADARQERREERKSDAEERLNIDINEEADHLKAAQDRLGVDSEPVVLETTKVSNINVAVETESEGPGTTAGSMVDLSALGGEDIVLLDENCKSCITRFHVEVLERGNNFGFGFVMRYDKDAINNPRFVFNNANMVELSFVEYGTDHQEYEGILPDSFDAEVQVGKSSIKFEADGEKLLRAGDVGPLASGTAFGFYIRDGRVKVSELDHTNWG